MNTISTRSNPILASSMTKMRGPGSRAPVAATSRMVRTVRASATAPATVSAPTTVPQMEKYEKMDTYGEELWSAFERGAERFSDNPLHAMLRSDESVERKLEFVPNMTFFVMGFKDLMELVKYSTPSSKEQESVNLHSVEDGDHWEWYLRDLQLIANKFCNSSAYSAIEHLWHFDTLPVRETVYAFSRYVLMTEDPVARMLLIEVLEVTFDKFKEAVHPVLKESGMYNQLKYFGMHHQDTEENHTTKCTKEEICAIISRLTDEQKRDLTPIVEELFERMFYMTEAWAGKTFSA